MRINGRKLEPDDFAAFEEALSDAFNLKAFKIMLRKRLGWEVLDMSADDGLITVMIHRAEKDEQTQELLRAALKEKPNASLLKAFAQKMGVSPSMQPPTGISTPSSSDLPTQLQPPQGMQPLNSTSPSKGFRRRWLTIAIIVVGLILIAVGVIFRSETRVPSQVWPAQKSNTTQVLGAVAWSGSVFVAVGGKYNGVILTSSDGSTWPPQSPSPSQPLHDVIWSGPRQIFVAVGNKGTILTSLDGNAWTLYQVSDKNLYNIAWSDSLSLFVVVGNYGTILTSPNGSTWMPQNSGTQKPLYGDTAAGDQLVAVGGDANAGGIILTSEDKGITWKIQDQNTWPELNNVAWSGSQLVVVGGNTHDRSGIILTSLKGSTWTVQESGTWPQLIDVAWSGPLSLFAVVRSNGTILTSSNGSTWTPQEFAIQTSGSPRNLFGIAWLGSHFIAVGDNGTILTSPLNL